MEASLQLIFTSISKMNRKKSLLITLLFSILYLFDVSAQTELVPYRLNEKWGYVDTSMKIIIDPQFDFTDFFQGEMGFVKKDSLFYGIDKKGNILTPGLKHYGFFNFGLCPVQLSTGVCLYIDQRGQISIDKGFDAAENFSEGLAVVSVAKKLGIINTKGDWVRTPDFDTSSAYYKSGFIMAISKGKYFYIDRQGKTLDLPDSVLPGGVFSEGLAPVYIIKPFNSEGKPVKTSYLEFIDSTGKVALSHFMVDGFDYSEYIAIEKEFVDGKAIIKTRNELGWDYYFLDKKGRFSPLYSFAKQLGDSLFLGAIGYYMADVRIVDSNYYVMGQFQQKPTQVGEMGEGLLAFRDKDGNWGYINDNCLEIIKPKYSAAFPFKDGFAYVIYNGHQGVIDRKGREYWLER